MGIISEKLRQRVQKILDFLGQDLGRLTDLFPYAEDDLVVPIPEPLYAEGHVGGVMSPIQIKDMLNENPADALTEIEDTSVGSEFPHLDGYSQEDSEWCPNEATRPDNLFPVLLGVVSLQQELMRIRKHAEGETGEALEHVECRLEEILERSGAEAIDGETRFNLLRHQPQPATVVQDGTPIEDTVVPGWRLGDRILRRAIVKVKKS